MNENDVRKLVRKFSLKSTYRTRRMKQPQIAIQINVTVITKASE